MTRRELDDLHQAVGDTRRVVKSLQRHARTATQLLTDLEERLDRLEIETHPAYSAQEAQNGTHPREPAVR